MPRGDRTGPWGFGPMSGRGMGYCSGYPYPGFMNPGPGFGFGPGFGMGRGFGRGFGRGRGWRRGGFSFWGYPYPPMSPYSHPLAAPFGYPFPYSYGYPYPTGGYPFPESAPQSQKK
jgi:hypothetical protein